MLPAQGSMSIRSKGCRCCCVSPSALEDLDRLFRRDPKSFFARRLERSLIRSWGVGTLPQLYELCFGIYAARVWSDERPIYQAGAAVATLIQNIILARSAIKADPNTSSRHILSRKGISQLFEEWLRSASRRRCIKLNCRGPRRADPFASPGQGQVAFTACV